MMKTFHLRIDEELLMILKQNACIKDIQPSHYISLMLAEQLGVKLNPNFSLNLESAKELRMKQIDESIDKLEVEKARLRRELNGEI